MQPIGRSRQGAQRLRAVQRGQDRLQPPDMRQDHLNTENKCRSLCENSQSGRMGAGNQFGRQVPNLSSAKRQSVIRILLGYAYH